MDSELEAEEATIHLDTKEDYLNRDKRGPSYPGLMSLPQIRKDPGLDYGKLRERIAEEKIVCPNCEEHGEIDQQKGLSSSGIKKQLLVIVEVLGLMIKRVGLGSLEVAPSTMLIHRHEKVVEKILSFKLIRKTKEELNEQINSNKYRKN